MIKLVLGGFPCFGAGTLVLTNKGYVNIEDIKVGDKVLTHKNRFMPVTKIGNKKAKTVVLNAEGISPTIVTLNHPYYVINKIDYNTFSTPEWIKVIEMSSENSMIGINIIETEQNPLCISAEDCWYIGRYIAGDTKIRLRDDLISILDFGTNEIKIPIEILNLPNSLLKIMIDGYLAVSKFKNPENKYIFAGLNMIFAKLNKHRININHSELDFCINKIYDNKSWTMFNGVLPNKTQTVYNLSVAEDESYTANNAIVHNCTQFSIAQKINRINKIDFTAEDFIKFHDSNLKWYQHIDRFEKEIGNKLGVSDYKFSEGLQLFFNCIVAVDKMKQQFPNDKIYYLFENVSSMQLEIKKVLTEILNKLYDGFSTEINSNLMSAQNRKRIYFTNFGPIPQPSDKHIVIKDILDKELNLHYAVNDSVTVAKSIPKLINKYGYIPNIFNPYNAKELLDKTPALTTGSLVSSSCAVCMFSPILEDSVGIASRSRILNNKNVKKYESNASNKLYAITTAMTDSMVATPIRIGDYPSDNGVISGSQGTRIYSIDGKTVSLTANGGGQGAKTGLYATPIYVNLNDYFYDELFGGNLRIGKKVIYKVKNGLIPLKNHLFPIKLPDGYYIIRRLSISEAKKAQTVPDWYSFDKVSESQAFKILGNGWTCDIISYILSFIPNILSEQIDVLSLYDGMSCGKIALLNLELNNNLKTYYAYEIDKYAILTSKYNFPEIIQKGDAYAVRFNEWKF